jgi:hypothetical protein
MNNYDYQPLACTIATNSINHPNKPRYLPIPHAKTIGIWQYLRQGGVAQQQLSPSKLLALYVELLSYKQLCIAVKNHMMHVQRMRKIEAKFLYQRQTINKA